MKFKLIDNQKRSILSEGRNYGVGFAFCRINDETIETIMPISACKDFLNDVVWSEIRDKEITNYGLTTKKTGIFEGRNYGCIVFKVLGLGARSPQSYTDMEKDKASYKANLSEIQASINVLEERMGVSDPTLLFAQDGFYVAFVPMFWCVATYRISLWSLLVRALRHKSDRGDPIEYLKTVSDEDSAMLTYGPNCALNKLKLMLDGNIPEQDMHKVDRPHNLGIVSFKF